MTTLPEWMHSRAELEGADYTRLQGVRTPRKRHGFARGTLKVIARFFSEMLDNESIASRRGLLQCIDARVKVITIIGFILVATFVQNITTLFVCYVLCITLAAFSHIPAKRFAKVWLLIPLFTALIIFPATLNIVTDGNPVLVLRHLQSDHFGPWRLPHILAITDNGLYVALRFILRTAVCVTLALLLAATTQPYKLFKGLRMLGVPKVFVMTLAMMERYVGLLARVAEEIHLAKLSRTITALGLRREHKSLAAGIGSLFRRTQILGNNIYLAMLSRGYTGEVHILQVSNMRLRDWLYAGLVVIMGSLLLILG